MHHVSLNRPGPHDRHFDHQIVKLRAACNRGSIDICARDSIWNTPMVSARPDHVVDAGVLGRDVATCSNGLPAIAALDQIERVADRREHAQRQHIDLQHAQRIEIVLVPLDDGASAMAAFSIGTSSHSGPCEMTKPPTCCDRCRGKPRSCRRARAAACTTAACRDRSPLRAGAPATLPRVPPVRWLFASRSTCVESSPSALPTSRTALLRPIGDDRRRQARRGRGRICRRRTG